MEPTAVQAAIHEAMKDTKTELVGEFNKEFNKKNDQIKELSAKVNELSGKLTEATNKQNTKKALGEGKQPQTARQRHEGPIQTLANVYQRAN